MTNDRLKYLMDRHVARALSADEQQELGQMLADVRNEKEVKAYIATITTKETPVYTMREGASKEIFDTILAHQAARTRATTPAWRRWGWAAAVSALCCGAGWYGLQRPARQLVIVQPAPIVLHADSKKVTLTLADGREVALDSNGQRSIQQGILQRGTLLQYAPAAGHASTVSYNILSVPRGGQFQLVLPDGSKVWLNADTRLRYPTAFRGKERMITLEGEGYFEIAPDAGRPFIVKVDHRQEVYVLGTAFNIMAYANESQVTTTLVSGAVKVRSGNSLLLLHPGQQAVLDDPSGALYAAPAAIEKTLAWKRGFFELERTDLPTLMRQLSRWYDVQVVDLSGGKAAANLLGGRISRDLRLQDVLAVLERYDIHCHVDGNNLIILP